MESHITDDRAIMRSSARSRLCSRNRARRTSFIALTAMVALAGQAAIALIAPAAEARSWRSVPAHVEPEGTTQHHVHNAADCAACLAMQLTGLPRVVADQALAARGAPVIPPVAVLRVVHATRVDPRHSRAPPEFPAPIR